MPTSPFFSPLLGIVFLSLWIQTLESQEKPKNLEKVEVIGTNSSSKNENFKKNPAGFQKEILLEETNSRYLSLPDILEREAGIRVRQFGGLGSYSTLSLRGTNPNQTRIYWNGIPINQSQNGEINLADLPFDNLEKVEIYKSGTPTGFSGSSIGGSLNLVSKRDIVTPATRFTIQGGSLRSVKGVLSHSDKTSFGNYFIQALGEKSDQNFSFLNNKGTLVFNTLDDTIDQRRNAQFEKAGTTANVNVNFQKTTLSFLNDYLYRFQGLPGPGFRQTTAVERKFQRISNAVSGDTKEFIYPNVRLEYKLYHTANRDELFDPRSEFSFGTPNALANSKQYGIQISPTIYLAPYNQILRFSVNLEQEYFDRTRKRSNNSNDSREPTRRRDYRTLQVQDEIRLFQERVSLVPQIRWDSYHDFYGLDLNSVRSQAVDLLNDPTQARRNFTNPAFGIRIQISKTKEQSWEKEWGFKSNISKDYRIPTFLELFGERGTILGNSRLKPEMSRNSDFGLYWTLRNNKVFFWDGEAVLFDKKIYDMILFVPNSQFTLRPENLDAASLRGLELSQKILLWETWKAQVQYTYQNPINVSRSLTLDGKFLPLRPKNQTSITISYQKKTFEIGTEYLFIGANYRDRTNEFFGYLPARELYNFFCSFTPYIEEELQRSLTFSFEVRNITNKQVEDFVGYPLPGRLFFLSGSYRF